MKKIIFLALGIGFISSCASTGSQDAAKVAALEPVYEKGDLICEYSKRTGSNLKKARCWTKEGYAAFQKQNKEDIEKLRRSGMAPLN